MDDLSEDERMFLVDNFMEDSLDTLEREQRDKRTVRMGSDIVLDLQNKGPLYNYIKARRIEAKLALIDLVNIPAENSVEIAKAQASVQEYLRASEWVGQSLEEASIAKDELNGEHYAEGN